MTVREFAEKLSCKVCAGAQGMDKPLQGCYVCDLLSYAMSHAQQDNIWITVQTNINVIAVAVLTEVGCVILPEGLVPDENAAQKAEEEHIPVLSTKLTAYEIITEYNRLVG